MNEIFAFLNEHQIVPTYGAHFTFKHVRDACIALDSHKVNGKIVVTME